MDGDDAIIEDIYEVVKLIDEQEIKPEQQANLQSLDPLAPLFALSMVTSLAGIVLFWTVM